MFQSSAKRLRTWLALVDEALAQPEFDAPPEREAWVTHPHRRPLHWGRERRAGSVPHPPEHCLCPVRRSPTSWGCEEELLF